VFRHEEAPDVGANVHPVGLNTRTPEHPSQMASEMARAEIMPWRCGRCGVEVGLPQAPTGTIRCRECRRTVCRACVARWWDVEPTRAGRLRRAVRVLARGLDGLFQMPIQRPVCRDCAADGGLR
jgi:hypothetical protein